VTSRCRVCLKSQSLYRWFTADEPIGDMRHISIQKSVNRFERSDPLISIDCLRLSIRLTLAQAGSSFPQTTQHFWGMIGQPRERFRYRGKVGRSDRVAARHGRDVRDTPRSDEGDKLRIASISPCMDWRRQSTTHENGSAFRSFSAGAGTIVILTTVGQSTSVQIRRSWPKHTNA
jgi:hypothetical protein